MPNAVQEEGGLDAEIGPCIPQKSPWFSRQTVALNAAILVGGLLLLCMAFPVREQVFVPGELSGKHAQILGNRLVSDRCSMCHPNSHGISAGVTQDALCMKCHTSHMPDASLQSPHDLTAAQLQHLQGELSSKSKVRWISTAATASSETTTTRCAQCHIEHHGVSGDLKAITDSRCQSCHQEQFHSFADGHPPFDDFPYRAKRSIAFDHASHASKYFSQKNETFDCQVCHVNPGQDSAVGPVMRTVGFEQACARCHAESLQSKSIEGWAILQLPSIESQDSENNALNLQDWPAAAQFGYEGEVSVALRLLLAADDMAAPALKWLPADGQLAEIPKLDLGRANATRRIAIGVRRLIADVSENGQKALKQRLEAVAQQRLGREASAHELFLIDEMCAGIPPDLFRQMQVQWFGAHSKLATDRSPASSNQLATRTQSTAMRESAQLPDEESQAADRRLEARLVSGAKDLQLKPGEADLLLGGTTGDDALFDDANETYLAEEANDASGVQPSPPLSNALNSSPERERAVTGAPAADGLLSGDGLLQEDDDSLLSGDLQATGGSDAGGLADERFTQWRGSQHVAQGGWFLDNELLALRYMPRGHADRTLAAWAEFASLLDHATQARTSSEASDSIGLGSRHAELKSAILGGCTECHLLNPGQAMGSQLVASAWAHWEVVSRSEKTRPFTKFDHTPHLTLPALDDCRYCHVLQDQPPSAAAQASMPVDPARPAQMVSFSSAEESPGAVASTHSSEGFHEFVPMKLEQCVACHRSGAASDGCTVCHNYHVGTPGFNWSQSLK
ncbi:hypothetical protein [Aureliella helgolandensis]|uniref:hypothetical protein n=1 Tax=Aureliella helgolandensis TaxID=2527968 RepID=UPI0011A27C3B|nr:hypothetical protein [Aureliella helgolandensis]